MVRVTMNSAKPPKYIAVSLHNEFMDTPFYVPFRKPSQNSPETIAQALLQLNAQSGKRLKLFKRPLQIKVFGIFGFKNSKKERKKDVVVKRGKLKRQISTWKNEGKKKEKKKKVKSLTCEEILWWMFGCASSQFSNCECAFTGQNWEQGWHVFGPFNCHLPFPRHQWQQHKIPTNEKQHIQLSNTGSRSPPPFCQIA